VDATVTHQVVRTSQGSYRALVDEDSRLVLVDAKALTEHADGARVRAFQPHDARVQVRSLERGRGQDWER
jgi:hypothetical protein